MSCSKNNDKGVTLAGELIAMIRINAHRGTFATATVAEIEAHLKPWIDRLLELRAAEIPIQQQVPESLGSPSGSRVEDAVVDMIRRRGVVGRRKYRHSMDRKDLHPDEWIEHHQEELADALQYAERLKGAMRLLHDARDIMMTLIHERDWECAKDWVDNYHSQFFLDDQEQTGEALSASPC